MTAASDWDDHVRDAEQIARDFVAFEQAREAREQEATRLVSGLWEYLVAIATSRLLPGDRAERQDAEDALVDAATDMFHEFVSLDPEIIARALWIAMWDGAPVDGGKAADREARRRLLTMRDVRDVSELEGRRG